MKQREKCSGRGFDSRLVHHKHILLNLDRDAERCDGQCVLLMGQSWFRQGKE